MRYDDPQLRDELAVRYVLGTLTRRARQRFARLLKYDVALRHNVSRWEAWLAPLADAVPAVAPPQRVWRRIEARIAGERAKPGFWASLAVWRGFAAVSAACVIGLATLLVLRQPVEPPLSTIAVLADSKAQPAMVVSWPPQVSAAQRYLKVKMLAPPALPPGRSFELWMLPDAAGKQAPVSLGVVAVSAAQTVRLTEAASKMLPKIWGIAVSVEPEGGSKTGQPTGPVILSGPCVKVI